MCLMDNSNTHQKSIVMIWCPHTAISVIYQKGISNGTTCSNSARLQFVNNRRRAELSGAGDYIARLKFLTEDSLIGVKPCTFESRRKSSSFCGEIWIEFCLLSSRLQMTRQREDGYLAHGLSSHFQALHKLHVCICDMSRLAQQPGLGSHKWHVTT